jgi:hypothetical protein
LRERFGRASFGEGDQLGGARGKRTTDRKLTGQPMVVRDEGRRRAQGIKGRSQKDGRAGRTLSACRWRSLAFGTVVSIRSCWTRAVSSSLHTPDDTTVRRSVRASSDEPSFFLVLLLLVNRARARGGNNVLEECSPLCLTTELSKGLHALAGHVVEKGEEDAVWGEGVSPNSNRGLSCSLSLSFFLRHEDESIIYHTT